MNIDRRPWHIAAALTIVMSIATGIGNYVSQYLLLSVKSKEEAEKAVVERRAKGEQLHCDKLQGGATLAAQIEFSADRGYPNAVLLSDLILGTDTGRAPKIPHAEIEAEQLALEKRAAEIIPFLAETEADILSRITLHHHVVTRMRSSKVPLNQRALPSDGGFDSNKELAGIREGAAKLASLYRAGCTAGP